MRLVSHTFPLHNNNCINNCTRICIIFAHYYHSLSPSPSPSPVYRSRALFKHVLSLQQSAFATALPTQRLTGWLAILERRSCSAGCYIEFSSWLLLLLPATREGRGCKVRS